MAKAKIAKKAAQAAVKRPSKQYGRSSAMAAVDQISKENQRAAIAQIDEMRNDVGATPPPAEDQMHDKLVAVTETLMRNLQNNPQTHWRGPILAALRSAVIIANAQALQPSGEDRALDRGQDSGTEEIGHDFLMNQARYLGGLAQNSGLRPSDVKFRWLAVKTQDGENVYALFPVISSGRFSKLTRAL